MSRTVEDDERKYLELVSRRLRASRVLAGVTQDELAVVAGMSRVTLGGMERGDHGANVLTYRKVARALGIRMSALLDEEVP